MDKFTKKVNHFIAYGHKHTGELNPQQRQELIISFISRNEFPKLFSEFVKETTYELAENLRTWALDKNAEENIKATLEMFFDYHVDLLDEIFEAKVEKWDTDYCDYSIDHALTMNMVLKEAQHAKR